MKACLELAQPIVATAELNRVAIESRLDEGYLDATTLMEYCIKQGIPQRTAHHLVGSLVREAMTRGCTLAELPDSVFDEADDALDANVKRVLGVQQAVSSFCSYGSTCPDEVRKQIESWKHRLK